MGILIVVFLFGDRDIQCSYFPNDRVLYDLRAKEIKYLPETEAQMVRNNIDTSEISAILMMGNVDFSRSDTENDSCNMYWIDFKPKESRKISAQFRNCDSTATVLQVLVNEREEAPAPGD